MSSADVAGVLGSPNMVTTDDQRRESWVYDKVSTDNFVSGSSGFFFAQNTGNATSSRTQRTLTIIIKFDENGKVRDFAYNQTKF
jgi:outer membrane protein assembly factor BamE (lipoprotein component of BamABCDE complex)